jgi:hypothetical protein
MIQGVILKNHPMYSSSEIIGCTSLKIFFFMCIPYQYILEMVDHPIIISVFTQITNGMHLITCIYVRQDALFKAKLSHYTIQTMHLNKLKNMRGAIDARKSMSNEHITRAVVISSSE